MSALAADYCEQIKKHLKILYATFPPNEPLQLGDFGVLDDDVFVRVGNISQFGVPFTTRAGTAPATIDFSSEGSVDIEFKAGGTAAGVKASVEFTFSSKHAVFFSAAGCTSTSVENQTALGAAILELFRQDKWQKKHVIVTSLIKAASTTAIASAASSASLVLEAESPTVVNIDLTDASLKLALKRTRAIALKVVTEAGCTPLMGLSGIKGRIFGPDDFGTLRTLHLAPATADDEVFMQVS